jgi:hypothetical protein
MPNLAFIGFHSITGSAMVTGVVLHESSLMHVFVMRPQLARVERLLYHTSF